MDHSHHSNTESTLVEYIKFIAILVFISGASFVAYKAFGYEDIQQLARLFMGVFMLVFATFKFIGYSMFVQMFAGYDLIAKKSKLYSQLYPFIELGLAVLFLADLLFVARNVAVVLIMGVAAIGVFQEIYHRRSGIHCACLGNVIKLPLSTVSLVENLLMFSMALTMLVVAS